ELEDDVDVYVLHPTGGYFVGPSHNILTTSWENIVVLRDAIEKYRKYPLNLN
ncbi:unnamed protein product, partial [marine sediment metagenome]